MKLSAFEIETPLWTKISAELNTRLALLREQNDGQLTKEETEKIRGRIAELKLILSWAKTDPQIM